ncbi:MAG: hypothetical protein JNL58_17395 [Planctomyces sp.]|nr:hypothetical protein [Planctomyces sp.]
MQQATKLENMPLPDKRPVIGAKARVLQELAFAGFPVPEFEVSPANLTETIQRLGFPVAVRSCAPNEDGATTSFAGMFRSVLNVANADELCSAIEACHASINSPAVHDYRLRHRIDAPTESMQVIVQKMVSASVSGVAFSIDPLTGDDRVVIEASEGTGDRLLSGHTEPLDQDHPLLLRWRPEIEQLARNVQRHFGAPQDIEFAADEDQLWLLQSRPVTRIHYQTDSGTWTNADFRDGGVSASVCSPLMWSLYERVWETSLLGLLREIHLLGRGATFEPARMFFGRPYWNLGAVKQCLTRIPGFVERRFDEDLSVTPLYDGDGLRTPVNLKTILKAIPTAWALRKFFRQQHLRVQEFLNGRFENRIRACEQQFRVGTQMFRHLMREDYWDTEVLYFRTIFAASLAKLDFKDAFPDADEVSLVAGIGPLRHLEPLKRIHALRMLGGDPEAAIRQLLHDFRHHQPSGLDVIHPRWDEQPDYVRRLFETSDIPADRRRSSGDFENARESHLAALPRSKRASFIRKLDRLRTFLFYREEMRDCSSRMYYLIRRCTLEMAGQRHIGDDIFFMTVNEIEEDDRSQTALRRDTYERFRNFAAPNEIGPTSQTSETEMPTANVLRGIAAGRGVSRGVARIVRTADEVSHLDHNVIIVCPFIDPGWTCALERVAGVVTETGGLLSHAAVICREFGLPTVLGVKHAAVRIPDGALIEVDGHRGEVRILSQEPGYLSESAHG